MKHFIIDTTLFPIPSGRVLIAQTDIDVAERSFKKFTVQLANGKKVLALVELHSVTFREH